MNRWETGEPPDEAHSRVTNPEKFRPLHDAARHLLSRLEATYAVNRLEGYGLDDELEKGELAYPTIKLVPQDLNAAPITIVFTAFPGLRVRVGHWYTDAFPACGCDACGEIVDDEIIRLNELVNHATAGRFREAIRLSLFRGAQQESEFGSLHKHSSSQSRISRSRARQMLSQSKRSSFNWKSWSENEGTGSDMA